MNEWTKAQEADFQELVRRAAEQSRECYRRRDGALESPKKEQPVQWEQREEEHHQPTKDAVKPQPSKGGADSRPAKTQGQPQRSRNEARPQPSQMGTDTRRKNLPAAISLPTEPTVPKRVGAPPQGVGKATPPPDKERKSQTDPLKYLMEKLDNEGLMLAMLLWLLIEEKADNAVIVAIAYILLV